jgi:N-acetyl sugar amidotransferase
MKDVVTRGLFEPDVLRVCTRTVMDNTDPDITFDEDGVSNWWGAYQAARAARPAPEERERQRLQLLREIRDAGRGKPYDCLLGLSGGVDSSYMAWLCRQWGLRPLILHFDNGWNDELAVANIETIVRRLDFRLETFVMNWPEFRDLQRAYFKASVIDLDVPSDHMIFGALYKVANERGIKFILSGNNFATEWLLPRAWFYPKRDLVNLKAIHRAHGERPLRELPEIGVWQRLYYERVKMIREVPLLEYVAYSKREAKRVLVEELGWKDYGGKHYESVFTRFYQGYVLPRRFGVDKRKAHLSNLILSGEMTRDEAMAELQQPTDDPVRQAADKQYVAKKLGWSDAEFEAILSLPPRAQASYGTDAVQAALADQVIKHLQPFARLGRTLIGSQAA